MVLSGHRRRPPGSTRINQGRPTSTSFSWRRATRDLHGPHRQRWRIRRCRDHRRALTKIVQAGRGRHAGQRRNVERYAKMGSLAMAPSSLHPAGAKTCWSARSGRQGLTACKRGDALGRGPASWPDRSCTSTSARTLSGVQENWPAPLGPRRDPEAIAERSWRSPPPRHPRDRRT